MDCSLPGSSVHGIFQARILEWAAISSSSQSLYWSLKHLILSGTCWPLHVLSRVAIFLWNQCTQFLLLWESVLWLGMLFFQMLLWLALAHHSGLSWKSTHPGEIFWQHRIENCLLPAFIRQITFFYCFQIMRHNQRVYFLFVQLYLCISRAAPIRMSTPWQQEIWLSCSLLHLKHSPLHNIRIPAEWIELWRMNGWICKWLCKLRAKKTSSGRKYVLTVTCRRVSQHF